MAPYNETLITETRRQRGPWGLFGTIVTSSEESRGQLKPGEEKEIKSPTGQTVGIAKVDEKDILQLKPQGDVEIAMGDGCYFKATQEDEHGERVWLGEMVTETGITLVAGDRSFSVTLDRV